MPWIEIIGYGAGILTLLNMFPQILKTYKTKNAQDVSYLMIITYALSMILWVIYAVRLDLTPVIITNGIALIMSLVQLGLMIKYSKST